MPILMVLTQSPLINYLKSTTLFLLCVLILNITLSKPYNVAQEGRAYNFYFEYRQDRHICTQLIESSFQQSGVSLNIKVKKIETQREGFRLFSRMRRIVKADDLLKGDF